MVTRRLVEIDITDRDDGKIPAWDDGDAIHKYVSPLVNPMTTAGDVIVGGASGTPDRLAAVAVGSVLKSAGTGTAPAWGPPFAANRQQDLSTLPWWAINSDLIDTNAAARAAFYPFVPLLARTVTTFNFYVGTQNGNLDMGIYDASRTKLASTGSFACPAIGIQTRAIAAAGSVALVAGNLYYIAYLPDGTTAKLRGYLPTAAVASGMTASSTLGVCAYLNSAGASLPAGPVSPTGYDLAKVPFISLT